MDFLVALLVALTETLVFPIEIDCLLRLECKTGRKMYYITGRDEFNARYRSLVNWLTIAADSLRRQFIKDAERFLIVVFELLRLYVSDCC